RVPQPHGSGEPEDRARIHGRGPQPRARARRRGGGPVSRARRAPQDAGRKPERRPAADARLRLRADRAAQGADARRALGRAVAEVHGRRVRQGQAGQRDGRQHPDGRAERARGAAHLAHLHRARRRARARGRAGQRSARHEGPEQPLPRRRDAALMLQTTFNGIITGVIMTLPALAITLLFGVLKFPNFAVGAMMTLAAYMAFALNVQLGLPLVVATILAAIAFGGFLIAVDYLTFKPLRERGSITLMVASLGLGFV